MSFVRSALRTDVWSVPRPGSPIGAGVGVRCGGLCSPSASTAGASRCGWVGGVGSSAPSSAGGGAPQAWPPATGGGSGRPPGSAGCGASAGAAVRGGSGPGPGPGSGRPGGDISAGRAGGLVGGALCCWGTDPPCVVAGRSSVPDVAEARGVRPPVGPWVWGCPASEGRAVVASVGVAVCVRVGRLSVGVYVGSAAGRSGAPWCGRGSGSACVVAAWLAAGRGPCAGATGGVRGCGLPVGLGAGTLCGCAVPWGCPGWVPTAPVFVGPGRAPLLAGDARCPRLPVVAWCCVGCRCAARLDARSCRGLCGVPALDGAGPPVVRVVSAACCWCGSAAGMVGAEVDGSGDVEDVAADVQARTLVALVAVVARGRGGGVGDGCGGCPGGVG